MVLRIVVYHPPSARQEAISLRDALQQTFANEDVSLWEASIAQSAGEANGG